jgi:hypothetical protein
MIRRYAYLALKAEISLRRKERAVPFSLFHFMIGASLSVEQIEA